MLKSYWQSLFADPDGTPALVRRLLMQQAAGQWRRYALAFALMGIAAASTALGAYLVGDVINQAYVHKNLPGIIVLALVTAVIFMIKGMATYGQAVMLARIGNGIIADNQRRMFAKLLHHNVGFFADRHSSEFMARLNTGAAAASQVLNLLITAFGRDLLSLVGLLAVMAVQDPVLSALSIIVVPPAMLILRKMIRRIKTIAHHQFTGSARILETLQETLQGMRIVKAFNLEDAMSARFNSRVAELENEFEQMGARRLPLGSADGGTRRICDRRRADLRRLPRDRDRGNTRSILFLPGSLHAGLRASQTPCAAQPRPQQRTGRGANPVRRDRPSADGTGRRRQAAAAACRARASNSPTSSSRTARARRSSETCPSSPSPERSVRWSAPPAAANRRSSI